MNAYIIFSSEDGNSANKIYKDLAASGVTVLGVKEDSIDNKEWKKGFFSEIRDGTYVLFLLSSKLMFNEKIRNKIHGLFLELVKEFQNPKDHILHLRLDDCQASRFYRGQIHCIDLFPDYDGSQNKILRFFVGHQNNHPADSQRECSNSIKPYGEESEIETVTGDDPSVPHPYPNSPQSRNKISKVSVSGATTVLGSEITELEKKVETPVESMGRIDRYWMIKKLGTGGFGAVYLAKDTVADVHIALKALPPLITHNKDELEDIRKNFSLASVLRHQNIAALLHLHKVENTDEKADRELGLISGHYLTIMEYVPGETLRTYQKQFPNKIVPVSEALRICSVIAEALDFAHSKKIIHRDIKPSNVMLTPEKEVKVLDFGIAAEIRSSLSRISNKSSQVTGTYPYMSPEQWQGKRLDGRSDQYALAVLLYELVNGEVPFCGIFTTNDVRLMRNTVLSQELDEVNLLGKRQNKILARALSKDPKDRFSSCQEFISKFEKEANGKKGKQILKKIAGILLILIPLFVFLFFVNRQSEFSSIEEIVLPAKNQAEEQFNEIKDLALGDHLEPYRKEVQTLVSEGNQLFAEKEYKKALEVYQKISPHYQILKQEEQRRFASIREQERATEKMQATSKNSKAAIHEKPRWDQAIKLMHDAAVDFDNNRFDSAQRKWKKAFQEFELAEKNSRIMEDLLQAKSVYYDQLAMTDEKLLEEFSGPQWKEIKEMIKAAGKLENQGRKEESKELWEKGRRQLLSILKSNDKVRDLDHVKQLCLEARKQCEINRKKAQLAKASAYAKTHWIEGEASKLLAERYFDEGEIIQAKQAWEEASEEFDKANEYAIAIQNLLREKANYKSELAKIDETLLYEFGGNNWERTQITVVEAEQFERQGGFQDSIEKWRKAKVLLLETALLASKNQSILNYRKLVEKAREARSVADWPAVIKFLEAALGINPNSDEAKTWLLEAKYKSIPRLTIISVLNKKEVTGGRVRIDGTLLETTTPLTIELEKGKEYTINVQLPNQNGLQSIPFETKYLVHDFGEQKLVANLVVRNKPEPGHPWKVAALEMDFVYIEPGTFQMGSFNGDDDEKPVHSVHLTKPFWIGKYEVSQGQFEKITGVNPSFFEGEYLPVESINWLDAKQFCNKLTEIERKNDRLIPDYVYRLPTEAEWEYSSRAGTKSPFCFGDSLDSALANFNGKYPYGKGEKGEFRKQTVAVNFFEANAWGIFNMHGNVAEWCLDQCEWKSGVITDTYYENIKNPFSNKGSSRIVRGGSWRSFAGSCRSASRHRSRPDVSDKDIGFRIVLGPQYDNH